MHIRLTLRRLSLLAATFVVASCSEPTQPGSPKAASAPRARAGGGGNDGTALRLDGTVTASTAFAAEPTTLTDNIQYDVMVRFDGPKADNGYQAIFHNGHGGVAGFGLMVLGSADGYPEGTLAILLAGIAALGTDLTLTPGVWQHIEVTRRNGEVTISLDGRIYEFGWLPVQDIGNRPDVERLSIGGDGMFDEPQGGFNGAIDKLRIRDLTTDQWIERFNFNEGNGSTAIGVNGTVVNIGGASWTSRRGSDN